MKKEYEQLQDGDMPFFKELQASGQAVFIRVSLLTLLRIDVSTMPDLDMKKIDREELAAWIGIHLQELQRRADKNKSLLSENIRRRSQYEEGQKETAITADKAKTLEEKMASITLSDAQWDAYMQAVRMRLKRNQLSILLDPAKTPEEIIRISERYRMLNEEEI